MTMLVATTLSCELSWGTPYARPNEKCRTMSNLSHTGGESEPHTHPRKQSDWSTCAALNGWVWMVFSPAMRDCASNLPGLAGGWGPKGARIISILCKSPWEARNQWKSISWGRFWRSPKPVLKTSANQPPDTIFGAFLSQPSKPTKIIPWAA